MILQCFKQKDKFYLDLPQGEYLINGQKHVNPNYASERLIFDKLPEIIKTSSRSEQDNYLNLDTQEKISITEYTSRATFLKSKAIPPEPGSDVVFTNEFKDIKDKIAWEVFKTVWQIQFKNKLIIEDITLEVIDVVESAYPNYIKLVRNIDSPQDAGAIYYKKSFYSNTIREILAKNGFSETKDKGNNTYNFYDLSNELSIWFYRGTIQLHRSYKFGRYGSLGEVKTGEYKDLVKELEEDKAQLVRDFQGDINAFGSPVVDAALILNKLHSARSHLWDISPNQKQRSSYSCCANILAEIENILKNETK